MMRRASSPAVLILLGLTLGLYAWNLGGPELTDTDESRSGVIVRDMVEGGHWLLPRTPDGYLCEKPPAYYVASAALASLLGRGEAVLRGVSVAMALGTLAVTAWLAGLYGSRRASWMAVVALGSNLIFLRWGRMAMVDMMFTFFITAGLAAYFAARIGRLHGGKAALICGTSFAAAVLTKGPLGIALPAAILAGDALVTSRGRVWQLPIPWGAVAPAALLAIGLPLAWYLPALRAGGEEFLETCILSENLRMPIGAAEGIGVSHQKPFPYYFWNQLLFLLPMAPLLPETVRWLSTSRSGPARAHLAAWAGAGFLLFLAAANKRHYYLLPLQPAFALMIALAADSAVGEGRFRLLVGGALGTAPLAILGFLASGFLVLHPARLESITGARVAEAIGRHTPLIAGMAVVGALAGATLLVAARRGGEPLLCAVAGLGFLVVSGNSGVGDAVAAGLNPNKAFVARVAPIVGRAPAAILPPFKSYGISHYWPTHLPQDEAAAEAAAFVLVRRDQMRKVGGLVEIVDVREYRRRDWDVLLVRRR